MSNNLGIYVHIPFCKSKCPYCDFFSKRGDVGDYTRYVNTLKNKIEFWSKKVNGNVDTIYFGGGTPSVLGAELLSDILNKIKSEFTVSEDCEITLEVNPASGKFFDFNLAKKSGFNRVSLGLQSSDTDELKALGRIHNQSDVLNTVKLIKSAGISNISLDLMIGIPNQTWQSLKSSIDFCLNCDVTHVSTYMLKIEENTIYHKREKFLNLPDDDLTSDFYLKTIDYLKENGFNQYEISNFSKSGYESKHNLKYWNLDNYLGIGPGAHSFIDGKRFFYNRSFEDFENDVIIDDGIGGTEEEYIMLKMRLTHGLDLDELKKVFGTQVAKDLEMKIRKYIDKYIRLQDNRIYFSPEGMLVSNSILSDLLFD